MQIRKYDEESVMAYSVAVIGLGAMGMGAAQSCVRAGLDTYGVDLSAQARDVLQAAGAKEVAEIGRAHV